MSINVDGDVILITGAAGGLGSSYARLLASRGARVVVNDTGGVVDGRGGDPEAAERVAAEIVAAGGAAVADDSDGSTVEGAAAAVQSALDNFGRIDAVIANAGILRDRTFAKVSDDDFFTVINVHLAGTVRVFHAAFPHMRAQGYGRLVSTASASGLFGNFGQSSYAAAKMGIVGLTQVLAIEGERSGITANVVAPVAQTRMTENLMGDLKGKASVDLVAPVVAYLVSRDCASTGQTYSVGAGRVARVDVGVTRGLINPEMTPEWVAENIKVINDDTEFAFPVDAGSEVSLFG